MSNKKEIKLDFEICDWWISWFEDEPNFHAVVRIGEQKYYIERKLEQT